MVAVNTAECPVLSLNKRPAKKLIAFELSGHTPLTSMWAWSTLFTRKRMVLPVWTLKIMSPADELIYAGFIESWFTRKSYRSTLNPAYINSSAGDMRSEEHTSELQSHSDLGCRLLLEQ